MKDWPHFSSKVTLLFKKKSIWTPFLIFLKIRISKKIWDPVDKNGPPRSPNGPFGPIFFLRLSPIGKLECTTYLQLPIPIPSYRNRVIFRRMADLPPPVERCYNRGPYKGGLMRPKEIPHLKLSFYIRSYQNSDMCMVKDCWSVDLIDI